MRQQHVYAVAAVLARHPLDASPAKTPRLPELAELAAPALAALRDGPRWTVRRAEVVPFLTALVLSQIHEAVQSLAPDPAASPRSTCCGTAGSRPSTSRTSSMPWTF